MAQRLYECMFLLDSSKYATDPSGTEDSVKGILERCEAELVVGAPWQDGRLAYEIENHRKGLHFLAYFRMDGSQVNELTRLCKLNDLILRHLIIEHPAKLFDAMSDSLLQHTGGGDDQSDANEGDDKGGDDDDDDGASADGSDADDAKSKKEKPEPATV